LVARGLFVGATGKVVVFDDEGKEGGKVKAFFNADLQEIFDQSAGGGLTVNFQDRFGNVSDWHESLGDGALFH
jgi:hypothetical protein